MRSSISGASASTQSAGSACARLRATAWEMKRSRAGDSMEGPYRLCEGAQLPQGVITTESADGLGNWYVAMTVITRLSVGREFRVRLELRYQAPDRRRPPACDRPDLESAPS